MRTNDSSSANSTTKCTRTGAAALLSIRRGNGQQLEWIGDRLMLMPGTALLVTAMAPAGNINRRPSFAAIHDPASVHAARAGSGLMLTSQETPAHAIDLEKV